MNNVIERGNLNHLIFEQNNHYDDEDNPWFISHDFEKGEWEKISEDDFNEFLGRISSYVKFDYTPFAK